MLIVICCIRKRLVAASVCFHVGGGWAAHIYGNVGENYVISCILVNLYAFLCRTVTQVSFCFVGTSSQIESNPEISHYFPSAKILKSYLQYLVSIKRKDKVVVPSNNEITGHDVKITL